MRFDRLGPTGVIDQSLTIRNTWRTALSVRAKVQITDCKGTELPRVTVSCVYGALEGRQVVVPGETVDFLRFFGPGSTEVHGVRLVNPKVETVPFPRVSDLVRAVPLDAQGNELGYSADMRSVMLLNPNRADVPVRVVSIIWTTPPPEQPQQALHVLPLAGLVTVPARGRLVLPVPPQVRATVQSHSLTHSLSLKAFFAVD